MTPDQQSRLDAIRALQQASREMTNDEAYHALAVALVMALRLIAELTEEEA